MKADIFVLVALAAGASQWFEQKLDHFHLPEAEAGSFKQRYWTLREQPRAKYGFLVLCGQFDCEEQKPSFEFPTAVASEHEAVLLLLEHRYYGKSLPYGQASMLPQLFAYLEVNQVLEDIAQFLRGQNEAAGRKLKWVVVGGGYAGALAAWARTRFPSLITAAWASSAPVKAVLSYTDYNKQVFASLSPIAGCAEKVSSLTRYVDELYAEGAVIPTLTDLLDATPEFANTPDGRPAMWYLADMVGKLVELGKSAELCAALQASDSAVASIAAVLATARQYSLANPALYAVNLLTSPIWTTKSFIRQLYWQHCSQLGLFPTASDLGMRSQSLNLGFWAWYCNVVFGYPGGLPLPNVEKRNTDLDWTGSRILFTNGSEDPWRWASEQKTAGGRVSLIAQCPSCAHCVDFQAETDQEPQAVKTLRKDVRELFSQWLPE